MRTEWRLWVSSAFWVLRQIAEATAGLAELLSGPAWGHVMIRIVLAYGTIFGLIPLLLSLAHERIPGAKNLEWWAFWLYVILFELVLVLFWIAVRLRRKQMSGGHVPRNRDALIAAFVELGQSSESLLRALEDQSLRRSDGLESMKRDYKHAETAAKVQVAIAGGDLERVLRLSQSIL